MRLSRKTSSKDPLLTRLETYLEEKVNKPLPYKQKPGLRPSSLGTDCLRKLYYSFFRVDRDEPINFFLARIFSTGIAYEEIILDWLKGMGEHIPYRNKSDGQIPLNRDGTGALNAQFPISIPEWHIPRGYIDNVAVVDEELWLYEIKTKNTDKFDELTEVDADHLVQTACYFKAFTDHLENGDFDHIPELKGFKKVTGVKVLYINKNNSNLRIFRLQAEDLVDEIIKMYNKIETLQPYLDKKELPPCNKKACGQYCEYKKKCRSNWNEIDKI